MAFGKKKQPAEKGEKTAAFWCSYSQVRHGKIGRQKPGKKGGEIPAWESRG